MQMTRYCSSGPHSQRQAASLMESTLSYSQTGRSGSRHQLSPLSRRHLSSHSCKGRWRASLFETTALVVSAVEQALFTRRRADIRFSSTLIGRHSSIRLQPAHHRTLAEQRFELEPCDGASGADLGRHLVRSGLGNRRVGSQGPPCADEVPLAARQSMPPTVPNGSAANVGGAGAGADRRLTQEAGRFFYWMDGGEAFRWQGFRLVKGRKHVAQGKVARRHHVHGGA